MSREAQDNLLLFVGVMMLQVGISDLHLRYVKAGMQPLIVGAGVVLTGLALVGLWRTYGRLGRQREAVVVPPVAVPVGAAQTVGVDGSVHADHAVDDGHGGHRQPWTAWLLALPLLVMALVTPPTLGAYAAARQATAVPAQYELPPLPAATDGAVELTLTDYYARVLYDPDTLAGQRIRLIGFVTPEGEGWNVTRMRLACCAADGRPVKVLALGPGARAVPAPDTWVAVEGTHTTVPGATGIGQVVAIEVDRVREVPQPRQTYED